MKDFFKILFMGLVLIIIFIYRDSISNFITDEIIYRKNNKILSYNEYYIDKNYLYVQNLDKNSVDNYQEILNMFYTIINSGDTNYSFYCNYENCINDATKIANDKDIIADINNFVHPYNSFESINIDIISNGKVNVKINKVYKDSEINFIDNYIDLFITDNITENMSNYDKIKIFHDFIVNTTTYDESLKEESYTAYSLITTNKSICGGYTDVIAIYLHKLGIQNYKITSENHIWNLINLDGIWYHVDATWDDPVASDGNEYLIHSFFMINTSKLLELDKVEHTFNYNVYKEAI